MNHIITAKNSIWMGAAGQAVSGNGCPPGTRQHQKTALFDLIKGRTLCLSDYEAESLRAQQQRDIQNNIRNSKPRFVNCYVEYLWKLRIHKLLLIVFREA